MDSQEHQAVQRLSDFFQAMNEWEKKFYPLMREQDQKTREHAVQEIKIIFEEYIVDESKNFARVHAPRVGNPPEYDNDQSTIEDVKVGKKNTTIQVRSTNGFKNLKRYTFVDQNGKMKITRIDVYRSSKDKWEYYHP